MDPATQPAVPQSASPQEISGFQSLLNGGMASVAQPAQTSAIPQNQDEAGFESVLNAPDEDAIQPDDSSAVAQAMAEQGVRDYKPGQGLPFGHYGAGMRTGDITPSGARDAAIAIGSVAGGTALGSVGELLEGAGPAVGRATQALSKLTGWAKANPFKAYALAAIVNRGLSMAGLPKASKIAENMEPWALLLLGDKTGGAEGVAEQLAEKEAVAAEPAAAAAAEEATVRTKTPAAGAGNETAEEFVNRVAPPRTPASSQAAEPAGEKPTLFGEDERGEPVDLRTQEQKQKSVDDYFAAHPEKRPQPKVIQRGPKKGQLKTYRVFDEGKWHEVQAYK